MRIQRAKKASLQLIHFHANAGKAGTDELETKRRGWTDQRTLFRLFLLSSAVRNSARGRMGPKPVSRSGSDSMFRCHAPLKKMSKSRKPSRVRGWEYASLGVCGGAEASRTSAAEIAA